MKALPTVREIARSCAILMMGRDTRPRRVLRGLASGYRLSVSPAENLGYLIGTAEPHLQRAIRKYVQPGDTAYDIGSNIGYVSLALAKRVGRQGRVFAFEPIPRNLQRIRENIGNNGLANIQVFDVAASDRRGETLIRIAENLATASLVWHKNDSRASKIVIRTVAIDELLQEGKISAPAFVKIDVEGAEGLVLRGMRQTLASSRAVLFVECSDAGRETAWHLLVELGYRCKSAITGKPVRTFEEYRHSDFLWLPSERPGS